MNNHKDITFWENKYRQNLLKRYQSQIEKYFSLIDYYDDRDIIDTDESKVIRKYLNKNNILVQSLLLETAISPNIIYTGAPAFGGMKSVVNLIEDLFNIQRYDISSQHVVDVIDKALGVYEADFPSSVIRTLNPLFWIGKLLEIVASFPFYLLGRLGFDRVKIEASPLGSIIKWLIKIITLFATLWQAAIFAGLVPADKSVFIVLRTLWK